MKRVRYLAGAAGLAPMALGALGAIAGGGAQAAAEPTGHGKAVVPYAQAPRGVVPDLVGRNFVRESCGAWFQDWLKVFTWSATGGQHELCFGGHGASGVRIYHVEYVSTGSNGVAFSLYYNGKYHYCVQRQDDTDIFPSQCNGGGVPANAGTMTELLITSGTN